MFIGTTVFGATVDPIPTTTPGRTTFRSYDYQYCLDHGWTKNCYGFTLEPGYIEPKMDEWVSNMNQFAEFWEDTSNIYHSGDLANKPLWLTEFGTLFAFCNQYLEMQPGQDEVGGIGCAAKADRSPSSPDWTDDYVFYGRNHNEGIWGMQYRQIQYLLNPSDDPNLNQGDWTASWFYQGYTGHGVNGRCNFTGWMFGDNPDCGTNQTQPSRAGRIYNETIN